MADADLTASVLGASGFAGGELLRILDQHPHIEVVQATSRQYERRSIGTVHPNLRESSLRFSDPADLESVDILFAATPHGVTMERIDELTAHADAVVDLSADFRLETEAQYDEWYEGHSAPEYLDRATPALPELYRDQLPGASS